MISFSLITKFSLTLFVSRVQINDHHVYIDIRSSKTKIYRKTRCMWIFRVSPCLNHKKLKSHGLGTTLSICFLLDVCSMLVQQAHHIQLSSYPHQQTLQSAYASSQPPPLLQKNLDFYAISLMPTPSLDLSQSKIWQHDGTTSSKIGIVPRHECDAVNDSLDMRLLLQEGYTITLPRTWK